MDEVSISREDHQKLLGVLSEIKEYTRELAECARPLFDGKSVCRCLSFCAIFQFCSFIDVTINLPLDSWQPATGMGHLVAQADRIGEQWSDQFLQGLARP